MTPELESTLASEATILVPVDASDPVEPPPGLVEMLGPHRVVVLGYYDVPDQSSTDQLRDQFGEEATEAVEEVAGHFSGDGGGAESTVVFTHDRSSTIDAVAVEYDVDAVLTEGSVEGDFERVLVPLRGEQNLGNIVEFVEKLMRDSDAEATFLHVVESDEEPSEGELIVRGATDRLKEDGVDPERVHWRQEEGSPTQTLAEVAEDYDLVVLGETKPSIRERLFGEVADRITEETHRSVLVVRH